MLGQDQLQGGQLQQDQKAYHCLIVDDEVALSESTCEYFTMFDVSTAWVASAAECLAFLKQHRVDLILLDINLGDTSGFELCKRLRRESDLPILFISARGSDDDILLALTLGGDDYIQKPYALSVLLAKVKAMLRRSSGGGVGGAGASGATGAAGVGRHDIASADVAARPTPSAPPASFTFGDLTINFNQHR
ncbi:MAG: response regulator, partial [Coriobacteriales bacterium]|nr:response regulator [Coriobacteriales bacterium]